MSELNHFSYITLDRSIEEDFPEVRNGCRLYSFENYNEFINQKGFLDGNISGLFTDEQIPSHDLFIGRLETGETMPVLENRITVKRFIAGTLLAEKSDGFCFILENPFEISNLLNVIAEGQIHEIYHMGFAGILKENVNSQSPLSKSLFDYWDNHDLIFWGLRKGIELLPNESNQSKENTAVGLIVQRLIKSIKASKESNKDTVATNIKIQELKERLISVSKSDGHAFERVLKDILTICFSKVYPTLRLDGQVPSHDGETRKDFIIYNSASTHSFLKELKSNGVDLLLFEAKNYKKPLSSSDITRFGEYIIDNSHYGEIGILLARNGVDDNCKKSLYKKWRAKRKIIVLNESDLLAMLECIESGEDPIFIIEQKYIDMIKSL